MHRKQQSPTKNLPNRERKITSTPIVYCNAAIGQHLLDVIVIYSCLLTNYTCSLKSKNALCSKKTQRTAKLNQSKKSIKLQKTNELRQNLKQLGKSLAAKSKLKKAQI